MPTPCLGSERLCHAGISSRGQYPGAAGAFDTVFATNAWVLRACNQRLGLLLRRRLYNMGVITTKKSLVQLERLSTAAFCRRRLAVVAVRLKMAETLREACTFVEQARCPAAAAAHWCNVPCCSAHKSCTGLLSASGGALTCSCTMIWRHFVWGS